MLELKETEHSYYCNDKNYYCANSLITYENFKDFYNEWGKLDIDYNYIFRFDLEEDKDYNTKKPLGTYTLKLYYMLQRKGNFVPINIYNVVENDIIQINELLKSHWEYTKDLWKEFSEHDNQ